MKYYGTSRLSEVKWHRQGHIVSEGWSWDFMPYPTIPEAIKEPSREEKLAVSMCRQQRAWCLTGEQWDEASKCHSGKRVDMAKSRSRSPTKNESRGSGQGTRRDKQIPLDAKRKWGWKNKAGQRLWSMAFQEAISGTQALGMSHIVLDGRKVKCL